MIDVLFRGLHILEYLARREGRPALLREIVADTGIIKPNAARLLQTLTQLGYVEKPGPRQGYVLGPMSYALGQGGVCEWRLQALAEPVIERAARELGEHLVLATMQRGQRQVLCLASGHSDIQIRQDRQPRDDSYRTATGRLLLAWMPEAELQAHVEKHGLPGEKWDNINSAEDMAQHLEAIRTAEEPVDATGAVLVRKAVPVWRDAKVVAALGLAAPVSTFTGEHRATCLRRLEETATQLHGITKGTA